MLPLPFDFELHRDENNHNLDDANILIADFFVLYRVSQIRYVSLGSRKR